MKKCLKTIKDIEALRNTDTKIYCTNSEDCIGKIGWFYNDVETSKFIDVVSSYDSVCGYAASVFGGWFKHFRPLTPEEVEKYTGYKVVEAD